MVVVELLVGVLDAELCEAEGEETRAIVDAVRRASRRIYPSLTARRQMNPKRRRVASAN